MDLNRINRLLLFIFSTVISIILFLVFAGLLSRPSEPGRVLDIEFWLNRYQTLVAAGIALFAAYLAWRAANIAIKRTDTSIEILRHQHSTSSIKHIVSRMKTLVDLRAKANDCWFAILQSDYSEIFQKASVLNDTKEMSPSEKVVLSEQVMHFANNSSRLTSERHAVLVKAYSDFFVYFENSPLTIDCKKSCVELYWLTNSMGGLSSLIIISLRNYAADCLMDKDVSKHVTELCDLKNSYLEKKNSDAYPKFFDIVTKEMTSLEVLMDRTLRIAESEV